MPFLEWSLDIKRAITGDEIPHTNTHTRVHNSADCKLSSTKQMLGISTLDT